MTAYCWVRWAWSFALSCSLQQSSRFAVFMFKGELFLSLSDLSRKPYGCRSSFGVPGLSWRNEPLDGTELISDGDGSSILLPSDGGLEVSGTQGESEVKSSDGKFLTTRVTTVMIRCAFLEVDVEEEKFAEFGDVDSIEDVGDESVQQEGPLGEGLVEAEVEHKVEEEALVTETLLTGTQPTWAAMMLNPSPGTLWILENLNHENLFYWKSLAPISHDIHGKPERENYFFKLFLMEQVAEAFAESTKENAPEDLTLSHNLVNI